MYYNTYITNTITGPSQGRMQIQTPHIAEPWTHDSTDREQHEGDGCRLSNLTKFVSHSSMPA
jgi:hypothetical protein